MPVTDDAFPGTERDTARPSQTVPGSAVNHCIKRDKAPNVTRQLPLIQCFRLSGTCAHLIALVYTLAHYQQQGLVEVPTQPSATSLPQQWHKPRDKKIKPDAVTSMVLAKPTKVKRKRKPVSHKPTSQSIFPPTKDDIGHLKSKPNTPLSYLISEDCMVVDTTKGKVQSVEDAEKKQCIISTDSYFLSTIAFLCILQLKCPPPKVQKPTVVPCSDTTFPKPTQQWALPSRFSDCNSMFSVTKEEAVALERATVQQSECQLWFAERQNRITASNFGKILNRKKECNLKFLTNLMGNKSAKSDSLTHGKKNEINAKEEYLHSSGGKVHLHDCGLVVNPAFSFLGASPDAKVCCGGQTGILEVKCPYSARNLTVKDAVLTLPNFYLSAEGESYTLDKTHEYYFQVQGQLMVTGAPFCDFVCYCVDTHVERIYPDVQFCQDMLVKLAQFYQSHAKPFIQRRMQKKSHND
ncbi:uncharacterized protein [Branchiostoma lanceolatum]|uniref:uncharacterized protein n=1 Tax=Branchiostoma lanceolatum TaxID=7740 RepID=UPI003453A51D